MNENEGDCNGSDNLMDCAISANRAFVDMLLDVSQIMIGLVGYGKKADLDDNHNLSDDEVSLNGTINSWSPGGGSAVR